MKRGSEGGKEGGREGGRAYLSVAVSSVEVDCIDLPPPLLQPRGRPCSESIAGSEITCVEDGLVL